MISIVTLKIERRKKYILLIQLPLKYPRKLLCALQQSKLTSSVSLTGNSTQNKMEEGKKGEEAENKTVKNKNTEQNGNYFVQQ